MGEVGVADGLAALVEHSSGRKLDTHQVRLKASKIICLQSRQEAVGAMLGRAWALHHSSGGHFGPTAFKRTGRLPKPHPCVGLSFRAWIGGPTKQAAGPDLLLQASELLEAHRAGLPMPPFP